MRLTVRLLLAWFAFFGLVVGGWQLLAPHRSMQIFRAWATGG
jgi:hypothetical protein